jgi:hypothetical protein
MTMMVLDMTVELAPIIWGMIGLMALSGTAILAAGLPPRRARSVTPKQVGRQRQTPRQILGPTPIGAHSAAQS